jgi:hypothetical protein
VRLTLDTVVPPIADPPETKYLKHVRVRSERLSRFWGRDVFLGAHVLLPEGWDARPRARYPLVVNHGHFSWTMDGWRETPPDPALVPDSSARFKLKGYNRIQQQAGHDLFRWWTGPEAPRVLLVEIQHPTPYYDDSYAVNSANTGPYGDAIQYELIPELERRFRGIGRGGRGRPTAARPAGGRRSPCRRSTPTSGTARGRPAPTRSTSAPTPSSTSTRHERLPRGRAVEAHRAPRPPRLAGHVRRTIEMANRRELALGTRGRSGEQWDVWQATYSPGGATATRCRSGQGHRAHRPGRRAHWRERYDLSHVLRRDWATLGPKLRGKLQIHVGDMDNYYLNDASTCSRTSSSRPTRRRGDGEPTATARSTAGTATRRAPTRSPAALSAAGAAVGRARMRRTAPPGADTVSWRY